MALGVMPLVPRRSSVMRRVLVGLGIVLLAALALQFYARAVWTYGHFDVTHYQDFWKAKWWLVAHLGGGSLALLLGPFQFSTWLWRRYVKVHRWMGRLYLSGVLIASVAAVYMGLYVSPKAFGIALLYLDAAWVLTSGVAYVAVLRRQFAAHRDWMIRSYVVTFAFVLFRFLEQLNVYGGLGGDTQAAMLVWVAWAIPLLLTEVVLQWRRSPLAG